MINNGTMINNVSLLCKLNELPEQFHLTGSRFFQNRYRSTSDIDYFVQFSPELQKTLESLGFLSVSKIKYGDSQCVTVLRGFDIGNIQIDIQMVKNVNLKIKVQEKLQSLKLESPTTEEWNLAFALLS